MINSVVFNKKKKLIHVFSNSIIYIIVNIISIIRGGQNYLLLITYLEIIQFGKLTY